MTPKAFVIGHPITHSLSPTLHGYWLAQHGLDGSYQAVDVAPAALAAFLDHVRAGDFVGGNVTLPLKEAVLPLCDQITKEADLIGAVNTLIVKDNKLIGSNTDQSGFLANLDQSAPGWDQQKQNAIILGAGGAARAILVALAARGFKAHILNRTIAKAEALAETLPGPFFAHHLDAFKELAPAANLLVNTTSVGMKGTGSFNLPLEALSPAVLVSDIVYTPLETKLLADAKGLGLRTVDGLGMLLHQAVPGFSAWFGTVPEVTKDLRDHMILKLENK